MIPLYRPFMPELPELENLLYSGKLAFGKYGLEFETVLKRYFSSDYVITTSSFNMAIEVALSAMGFIIGDKVIVSPISCLASIQPLLAYGLDVYFADVNPKTGMLTCDEIKKLLHIKPKAIIQSNLCGYLAQIEQIRELCLENNIMLIHDGIEGFGSKYKGEKLGVLGADATYFSFSAVRNPNTIDGGMVIFKERLHYEKSIKIRDAGIDRDKYRDFNGEINNEYDVTDIGYSATMSEINSYIGVQQMKNIDSILAKHRENALFIKKALIEIPYIDFNEESDTEPNYWVLGITTNRKLQLMEKLRNLGLYASGVHSNISSYSIFKNKIELPGAIEFSNKFLAIPCGWWITDIYEAISPLRNL